MKHESSIYRPEAITPEVAAALRLVVSGMLMLDMAKRELFYEKRPDNLKKQAIEQEAVGVLDIPIEVIQEKLKAISPRLLHAYLGQTTELGEKFKNVFGEFDLVNAVEEACDDDWYDGLELEALGVTETTVRRINQVKLDLRYSGGKVTGGNRNLASEYDELKKAQFVTVTAGTWGRVQLLGPGRVDLQETTPTDDIDYQGNFIPNGTFEKRRFIESGVTVNENGTKFKRVHSFDANGVYIVVKGSLPVGFAVLVKDREYCWNGTWLSVDGLEPRFLLDPSEVEVD